MPRESGTWRPRIEPRRAASIGWSPSVEYASTRRAGSSIVTAPPTTPATAFASAKRSPSGTPAIPAAAPVTVVKRLRSSSAWSRVHVISSGTERTATPRELRPPTSSSRSDVVFTTTAAAPACAAASISWSPRAVPSRTPTASTTALREIADKLGGVVDHRLANGHVEPERRNSHLNHVTTEVFEQRLERHRLVRRRRHRRVVVSIVRHDNGPRHARRLLLPPLSAMRL